MAAGMDREAFFEKLLEFQEGFVIGDLGGCRVWFQLLTALYLEAADYEGFNEPRLLLGEAFLDPEITPRNALIIPWSEIQEIHDGQSALTLRLKAGELRILPREAVELAGEVITGQVHRQSETPDGGTSPAAD